MRGVNANELSRFRTMRTIEQMNSFINDGEFDKAKELADGIPFEKFREFIISREYNLKKKLFFISL
jgi:hypothetical protein